MAHLSPEARRKRVMALRTDGMTYREIGRQLGISHEQARRDARDSGVTALTAVPKLGGRGAAFWQHATDAFELDQHEQELLVQACRLLDRADQLQAEIADHGLMVTSARGDRRPNPAVAEERQVSLAIGRLLAQLEIPSADDDKPSIRTGWQARAGKAADKRWDRERQKWGGAS